MPRRANDQRRRCAPSGGGTGSIKRQGRSAMGVASRAGTTARAQRSAERPPPAVPRPSTRGHVQPLRPAHEPEPADAARAKARAASAVGFPERGSRSGQAEPGRVPYAGSASGGPVLSGEGPAPARWRAERLGGPHRRQACTAGDRHLARRSAAAGSADWAATGTERARDRHSTAAKVRRPAESRVGRIMRSSICRTQIVTTDGPADDVRSARGVP